MRIGSRLKDKRTILAIGGIGVFVIERGIDVSDVEIPSLAIGLWILGGVMVSSAAVLWLYSRLRPGEVEQRDRRRQRDTGNDYIALKGVMIRYFGRLGKLMECASNATTQECKDHLKGDPLLVAPRAENEDDYQVVTTILMSRDTNPVLEALKLNDEAWEGITKQQAELQSKIANTDLDDRLTESIAQADAAAKFILYERFKMRNSPDFLERLAAYEPFYGRRRPLVKVEIQLRNIRKSTLRHIDKAR